MTNNGSTSVHGVRSTRNLNAAPPRRGTGLVAVAAASAAAIFACAQQSDAALISLQDSNSTVSINPNTQVGPNNGMYNWTVDGTNELNQQWFWYRVGNTGGEQPINNLTYQGSTILDTNGDGNNDYVQASYKDASNRFTLTATYLLTGGTAGSKTSDVAEIIKIVNTSGTPLNYHFFQYSDFNLGGAPSNDSVSITGGNTAHQSDNLSTISETVVSPKPSFFQAGSTSDVTPILTSLNDGSPTTLNDNATVTNTNATWAFQWDATIATGGSLLISKDKQITPIPEPTTLALLTLSPIGLMARRRRA